MCEWLSCSEWSDVRLQCGGRSFAAHRAVLASVSAFLRRILLSCPTEDSPTFIVLPDFDLDAMSSVLYYIYNGEVVIQKQKFEMFMEIVKAMQIFVDEQYLPSTCKSYDNSTLWSKVEITSEKNKIFCLGDTTVGSYINLKKGDCADCTWLKKSYNDSEFGHKQIRCADWCKPTLENMESASGDRQKDFLRGLFIETYPQNGNANGRAAGVLAIQSARYRAPASVLPTNANSKHLRAGDTHEIHNISTDVPQFFTNSTPLRQNAINFNAQSGLSYSTEHAQIEKFNSVFSYFNPVDPMLENSNESKNQFIDRFSSYQSQGVMLDLMAGKPTLDLRDIKSHSSINHKTVSMSHLLDNTLKESQEDLDDSNINVIKHNRKIQYSNTIHSMFSKATVLNEVLDSPWRPRQPNNYRPFRRKLLNSSSTSANNVKECIINDNNNNVQTSPPLEVIERISATVSAVEPSYPIAELAVSNDFKCAICDQVFTNEEALSAHVRRHSSPARYSCTECSKSFSQLRNFKYHMSVHRGTREFAATCSVCGKYFNDRGYLSSHMKIHRNRKEYKCSQCPKSFNQRVAYNMHVRIHTGIKPHVCNECGKAFSRKMLLKQHQRTHSGERPYACSHCDKRFADRSNMTLHLRLHTGVKPFSCTLCPKSFTKKHHLKSHLNFHTGAKPYSCPKCKLAFTQSSNMRTHLKKCTAPDPTDNAESQSSS